MKFTSTIVGSLMVNLCTVSGVFFILIYLFEFADYMLCCREFGIDIKEFDLLDEAKLSKEQVRIVCAVM